MDTTPPRTAPTADASTPPPGPVEIPAEFRSQRLRHKEYKRRGPLSGNRFDEEEIGETRTALSSRFFDAADESASAPSAPPPPPPPPPPPVCLPKRRDVGEERGEAVSAAAPAAPAAPSGTASTAAATAAETATATGTAEARTAGEAGSSAEGTLGGTAAIESRTGTDCIGNNAATERNAEGSCAGGKRKVGPEGREENKKTESPRKAAAGNNGGRRGEDGAVGISRERSVGEGSCGVEEKAEVEPESREGKGQGVGSGEGSGEESCGTVRGSAENGGADDKVGGRKKTPHP